MAFLQSLTPIQWGIIAAAIVAVVGLNWQTIAKFIPKPSPAVVAVDSSDPDVAALRALKVLHVHYKGCPEGEAALKVLGTHFLHHGSDA